VEINSSEDGKHIIIAGSGRSVEDHKDKILKYISQNDCVVIGINYMTSLCIPNYHMWTNKKRYIELGGCISEDSKVIIGGDKITDEIIRKHFSKEYIRIKHVKTDDIKYDDDTISGKFRTCGVLAIMVAHIMGAKEITVVGMDGYTLYPKDSLEHGEHSQHCYGSGYTDDADWNKCLRKDMQVYKELHALRRYGVDLKIVTPTIFKDFYDPILFEG